MILEPKLVAIDSCNWEQWINDNFSSDPKRRATAMIFEKTLMDQNFIILFTMHHLIELMAHENNSLVDQRLRFVQSRPFLSWIGVAHNEERTLGDITDVMTAEVMAVLAGADLKGTRDTAKKALLRSGPGNEAIPCHPDFLPDIRDWAREHAQKVRTHTALASWRVVSDDMPVQELMAGNIREKCRVPSVLQEIEKSLVTEIENHGDKRIKDAPNRANAFLCDMLEARSELPNTSPSELVLAAYATRGIDRDEIDPKSTVGDMDALGIFRGQLKVAAEKAGLDFEMIKRRIRPEQLPHRIVMDALERHGQKRDRRGAGDLYDRYLACLAVYSDVVFVDKRTCEDFRQTRRHIPMVEPLLGLVKKAQHYSDIPRLLAHPVTQ